ncbi:MAG: ATP-dependent DNA helicase RecG [Flavobacteriia bacterium]|nr:ATP-dependent DNA helicase RecG [Flavobacteriia bacterium]
MEKDLLKTPIEFLKGVGPAKADLLKTEMRIFTFGDLLTLYPFRYIDRSKFYTVKEIQSASTEVQVRGKITSIEEVGQPRKKRLVAHFEDSTGRVELVWFKGAQWIKKSLQIGTEYVLFGKPNYFKGKYSFPHPELEKVEDFKKSPIQGLQPVYPSTEKLTNKGLNARGIGKLTKVLLPQLKGVIRENLPARILEHYKWPSKEQSLMAVHFPKDLESLESARKRLKFEEFYFIQISMLLQKQRTTVLTKGQVFDKVGDAFNGFYSNHLPFELTGAQKRVLKEIRKDTKSGHHMNRLVQGDVGSGKTVVALLSMLIAADNGFQSCLMAPTEILAQQHYNGLSEMLEGTEVRIALLTGSTKTARRKEIHADLLNGQLDILVGTHALIEPTVQFRNLGLAVIDEQHRFGVAQRAKLWKKNSIPPHILIMTATPIPRTLAMSLYGDLDSSVIDELPPGRKPIKTVHRYDSNRLQVFGFMKEQIAKGRQCYVVYPLIEESAKMDFKDLEDGYNSICREFPTPDYHVSIVHGRMKAEDKDYEMQRFAKGETQIMVATTVIEVGVNVPNASVMVIESTERFGLSQLHQLRGRVGRGAEQSFCILMSGQKLSNEARTRIETMVRTNDGFEIADVDLQLRGPGDMMGTRQSGMLDLKIADITKDNQLLHLARKEAEGLLAEDPKLTKPEHAATRQFYIEQAKGKVQWSRIS